MMTIVWEVQKKSTINVTNQGEPNKMSNELAELIVSVFILSLFFGAYITTKEYFLDDSDIDYKKYTKEPKRKINKNRNGKPRVIKDDGSSKLDLSPKEFKEQIDYYSDYRSYLGSKKWKKIKRRRYIHDRGICQHCKKSVDEFSYHTHHLTYERLYNERLEDVITVHASCHAEIYKKDI